MTTAVIVAVRGPEEAELARAIEAHADLVVARRCADLVEAVAAVAAGVGGVVVVSDQPRLDRAVVRALGKHGVAIVGIPSSPDAAARLSSLGVATVTSVGAAVDEVVSAVVDSISEPTGMGDTITESEPLGEGAVISIWGPTGAPGRTTLAVNLATEFASLTESVILLDADTFGGAVAQALGMLDEAPGVAAVARAALEGSSLADAIRRFALEVRPGLRVLSGITQTSRWPELPSAALEPMLQAVRSAASVSVIDCGFGIEKEGAVSGGIGRNEATLTALAASDLIVVVGSAEPLGIQRLVRALGDLGDGEAAAVPRLVVVNRVRASVCGMRPSQAVGEVLARYAAVKEAWIIPDDPKACDSATLAGQALMERAPHSPARRAIEAIAKRVWSDVSGGGVAEDGIVREEVRV